MTFLRFSRFTFHLGEVHLNLTEHRLNKHKLYLLLYGSDVNSNAVNFFGKKERSSEVLLDSTRISENFRTICQ